jgi:hypothetical protein
MALFLTILEGPTPAEARPIVAISDAKILSAVRKLLLQRLSDGSPAPGIILRKDLALKSGPVLSHHFSSREKAKSLRTPMSSRSSSA